MKELANDTDDTALENLFAVARQFPLLSADEERTIDAEKWLALTLLQQTMVSDTYCRTYLRAWALNALNRPPRPDDFAIRDQYNLLKRELVGLLQGGGQHKALVRFSKRLEARAARERDNEAVAALKLPACLTAGLAEILINASHPRGIAAALREWQKVWVVSAEPARINANAQTLKRLRKHLAQYYAAREKLVNHNLRLVFSIAGKMTAKGISYRDLIQNGVPGLIRAAEKFQQEKGYRFSTYAYNWINQSIRQSVEDLRGIVRYPAGVNEQISRMYRERLHFINTNGREPDLDTLATRLQMEPDALQRLKQVGNLSVSLDAQAGNDGDGLALSDTLTGGPFEATQRAAEQISLNRCLMARIGILEPTERQIVIRRWGLDQGPQLSRAEIAVQMQVSTEWVRQLESSALAKLRHDVGVVQAHRDYAGNDP
ncbi:MAG: sigma-70 family RNA polymerase sigma factor [Halioglobus sp.]